MHDRFTGLGNTESIKPCRGLKQTETNNMSKTKKHIRAACTNIRKSINSKIYYFLYANMKTGGRGRKKHQEKEVSDILLLTLGEPQPSHSPGKQCAVLEGCSAIQKLKAPVTMQM